MNNASETAKTAKLEAAKPTSPKLDASTTKTPATGNRKEQKAKLKTQFSILTEANLRYENGKQGEIFTKIQEKLGKTKEELTTIICTLSHYINKHRYNVNGHS